MHLDIFNNDAFSLSQLTATITNLPHVPGRLGELGLFDYEGISTTSVTIESDGTSINLVAAAPRGDTGKPVTLGKRQLRSFNVVHLPQRADMLADEVQNLRAFGSETEVETVARKLNQKLTKARRNTDATLEWHRMGAVRGQVLDADGTTVLLDVYDAFGVTQITKSLALATTTTDVKQKLVELKRAVTDELDGLTSTGIRVLCSSSFFDALVGHASVKKAYDLFQSGEFLRTDQSREGSNSFYFAGVYFEEYRGKVGGISFIPDGEAFAIPSGVPGLFQGYFAPAPYLETVNTLGLPYYVKQWRMEADLGINVQVQSNPLHLCTRPKTVIKVTA